ncbi:MFS transporter [Chryseobacterium aureum]|uniref:MFS transporter n=1 Tax=Chryseobacterium aureum TaxID=2497456 RepID=UPI001E2D5BEB|nr:MFS transporter [Chryseobacterium aureum]
MVLGLLSLTYGTHELVHIQEHPLQITGSLVLAFALLVMVYYRLKSVAEPLVDLKLFKHKSLVVSNAVFFTLGAFFIGFLFLISLMLQKDMGYSAASAGLMLVPFSILSALTAKFILPQVSKRLSSSQMGILGWSFMLAGGLLLLISVYTGHPLTMVLLGAACISGVGMTFCFTALSVMGIQDVEPSHYGLASSLSSTSYFLGAGIGLSFMTLMSQIFPSELSVGSLNLMILIGYAGLALGMLFYFIMKNVKVDRAEVVVS